MKKYLFVLALLGACLGCKTDDASPRNEELDTACAYASRKTVDTITNEPGTIRVTQSGTETWTDIYRDSNPSTPYCACNLPASVSTDGLRITFSAEIKETYPNEKWRCQPIRLLSVTSLSPTEK